MYKRVNNWIRLGCGCVAGAAGLVIIAAFIIAGISASISQSAEVVGATPDSQDFVSAAINEPTETATSEPAATIELAGILADSAPIVITPLVTSRPATVAPEPTLTPLPTHAPEPTSTATIEPVDGLDVQLYLSEVLPKVENMALSLYGLGGLLADPQTDDPDWAVKTAFASSILSVSDNELRKISPPDPAMDAHAILLGGAFDCSNAVDLLADGIDNSDGAKFGQSIALFKSCERQIVEFSEKVQPLKSTEP